MPRNIIRSAIRKNEKVFLSAIIEENNLKISKSTMQRHLHKWNFKNTNNKKKVITTENQKRKRVEICKEWLKEIIDEFLFGWMDQIIGFHIDVSTNRFKNESLTTRRRGKQWCMESHYNLAIHK